MTAPAPRPEPAVAPLPSEAVDEEEVTGEEHEQQQDRIRAIQKHIDDHLSDLDGVQNWGDGYVLVGEWPVDFLAQSIAESMDYNLVAPIVRAVPEDDEDTVRVPRAVLDRAAAAINVAVAHAEGRVHTSDGNRAEELAGCRIARDDLQLLIDGATR